MKCVGTVYKREKRENEKTGKVYESLVLLDQDGPDMEEQFFDLPADCCDAKPGDVVQFKGIVQRAVGGRVGFWPVRDVKVLKVTKA